MIVYPPAKINIGLFVTEKRPDGYHNIETVFYPIPLTDTLEIELVDASEKSGFACSGINLPDIDSENNLCQKAYRLLDADYNLPPVNIRLHKNIPVGAGLGGGSSDAAYTLRALNTLFDLRIPDAALSEYAGRLGSDCAFFLHDGPALGTGRGEILQPISLSLAEYHILLVKPPVFVSTATAYASVNPRKSIRSLSELIVTPISDWHQIMVNDFEPSVFAEFPEIGRIKKKMYEMGAVFASMSGSGSSVYGFFKQIPETIDDLFPGCFVWK